jgi:type IV secretion system protein VirD4
MGWIIGGGIGGFIFILLLAWRCDGKKSTTYGSARWASAFDLFKAGLFKGRGLRVGEWIGQLGVHYDGIHAITFGQSGTGKGACAILPNLLSYPWLFVVDPGGENTAVAVKWWRERGYAFGCINIFGMFAEEAWALPAHGFNPLDFLDPASGTFAADAEVFAEMLTPRTGSENATNSYFKDAAQSAQKAMLIHIKTTEPPHRQNLATLYEYVHCDSKRLKVLLAAMKANPVCEGLVTAEAIKIERRREEASEESSAVTSTIEQDLRFLADPVVREKFRRSDVDFSMLKGLGKRQKGGVISVVLPLQYVETHAAITRLALACAVLAMQREPRARSKVIFLIDEAAALGRMLSFPRWLATLRKYRVVIWSIWQNIGQLVDLYGKGWQTLVANCGVIQVLGVADLESAEHMEKLLGRCTIKTATKNGRGDSTIGDRYPHPRRSAARHRMAIAAARRPSP